MELTNNNNCSFAMALMGYQFPELADVEFDSNWLNVKIEVSHPRRKMVAVDPALLAYEVQWLIDWFRSVSAGRHDKPHLWFTEPCLSFHLSPTESDQDKLVVEFSHEFRPRFTSVANCQRRNQITGNVKSHCVHLQEAGCGSLQTANVSSLGQLCLPEAQRHALSFERDRTE
jgi:hypothetical protein